MMTRPQQAGETAETPPAPAPPRVSVVVSVYNDPTRLERAVASVLEQSEPRWELLLVDDGSTDATGAAIDEIAARDERIHAIHVPHGGIARARNAGMTHAVGDWIAVLDADDWWDSSKLHRQLEYLEAHPDVGVLGTTAYRVGRDGRRLGTLKLGPTSDEELRLRHAEGRPVQIVHTTLMIRRDILVAVGGYPEDFVVGEDQALINLRLAPRTKIEVMPEPLTFVEIHADSTSRRRAARIVEADDIVSLNLERRLAGEPELSYREAIRALDRSPWRWINRRRRQGRYYLEQQGAARVAAGVVSGYLFLGAALLIAPIWTIEGVWSKVRSRRVPRAGSSSIHQG